jgi:DNA-directed RNA polymerase subunit RPC12/RpoP
MFNADLASVRSRRRLSTLTEAAMSIMFRCENCGKRFKVDERSQGRRGRCLYCGHVMRIPGVGVSEHAHTSGAATADEDPPFKLSPPEPHPAVREVILPPTADFAPRQPVGPHHSVVALASFIPAMQPAHANEPQVQFELLDDDADPASVAPVSREIARGLQEIAEFEKDRRGYRIAGDRSGAFSFFGLRQPGPASWVYTKWRAGVSFVLKLFRWVDTWAYLISIPFLVLMILGIAAENRPLIHTGAVVVVLANYGRFWADLLAFFVRPYKDGPLHGLAFLFPPYMLYYLATRWNHMQKIVRRIAMSCIPILVLVFIYAFLPSANPEAKNVRSFAGKLTAGKRELDKEIESDLRDLETKVIKLEKPKDHNPKSQP